MTISAITTRSVDALEPAWGTDVVARVTTIEVSLATL